MILKKINFFIVALFLCVNSSAQIDQYQSDIIKLLNSNGTIEKYDFEYEKTIVSLRVRVASRNFYRNMVIKKQDINIDWPSSITIIYTSNSSHFLLNRKYRF